MMVLDAQPLERLRRMMWKANQPYNGMRPFVWLLFHLSQLQQSIHSPLPSQAIRVGIASTNGRFESDSRLSFGISGFPACGPVGLWGILNEHSACRQTV